MSKQARGKSIESGDVEQNLIRLGLLNWPRTGSTTIKPSRPLKQGVDGGSFANTPRHASLSQEQDTLGVFKNSSISKGTIGRHSETPTTERVRADVVRAEPHTKSPPPDQTQDIYGRKQSRMASMLSADRARSRRERTFVGGECAACEELLEHTLHGERILQFSCGHVAHEACFYEYIKDSDSQYCPKCEAPLSLDSSRGGSILDLSKLSNMVRSIAHHTEEPSVRSSAATPMPWDPPTYRDEVISAQDNNSYRSSTREPIKEGRGSHHESQRGRIERLGLAGHSRTNSGNASSEDYHPPENAATTRRHDYDLSAMETSVADTSNKNHRSLIPSPIVTVRSEFPSLTRSHQQQSLTCLVTVEVPEAKWQHSHDEISGLMSPSTQARSPSALAASLKPRSLPQTFISSQSPQALEKATMNLQTRVDNWHGLETSRFGKLRLHDTICVGKDQQSWQELECYLFSEMLICVKAKKNSVPPIVTHDGQHLTRCTLKGSILIKRHLKDVHSQLDKLILTLNLSVVELPTFHLQFQDRNQLENWRQALLSLNLPETAPAMIPDFELDASGTDDEDSSRHHLRRVSSTASSNGPSRSATTAPTDYSYYRVVTDRGVPPSLHTPLDMVVVIPVSSSMQGLKISLLKDTLRFLISNLGDRDRMGLVTFGSQQGGVPLVGMTTKKWAGWNKVISSIKPVRQKSLRADVVEGANIAMDLLMQRKATNPISTILLISDSSTSDSESVNFVVSRAEAAKVGIYSFGLGLTHKPDSMIELSSKTKASYLYVKDWMMLRESVAGCLGSLQSISHQNAKLRLRLPEGSPAKFVKVSGALQTTKRATGREAEATLGDLRFGDKRDILVQLVIEPDNNAADSLPQDHWESIVSGLEALGGAVEVDESRIQSIEEVPLLQANLSYTEVHSEDATTLSTRPSLLILPMLPTSRKSRQNGPPVSPPIPPHPSIVQRRMELLTSDMLMRALTLVSKQQHDRAHHLLAETRTILKGLAKGGLPPLPPGKSASKRHSPPSLPSHLGSSRGASPDRRSEPDCGTPVSRSSIVDHIIMDALDADLEASLEWINHPAVFSRDSRKAVLQAIGTISSQRAYTFRSASESIWAERISRIKKLTEAARDWREVNDEPLVEEQ